MKKLALLFVLVFAAGVAIAQEKPAEAPKAKATTNALKSAQKTKAEVVLLGPDMKSVTLKLDSGETVTWTWTGPAAQLRSHKPGQKVLVTHKNVSGKESAVGIVVR